MAWHPSEQPCVTSIGGGRGENVMALLGAYNAFLKNVMRYGDFFSALSRYEKMSTLSVMGSFLERYCVLTLPKRALWRYWRPLAAPFKQFWVLQIVWRILSWRLLQKFPLRGWPKTVVSRFNMRGNVVPISTPIFSEKCQTGGTIGV